VTDDVRETILSVLKDSELEYTEFGTGIFEVVLPGERKLEHNLKMFGVSFAVDAAGDIYLDGRLPLHAVTAEELDRLLGAVLSYSDDSFNTILELGFASSIRKEWEWRESRGESTRNLEAFKHLKP
jgi:hypothetical protein